jgi:putative heme-binding domain-containing protein
MVRKDEPPARRKAAESLGRIGKVEAVPVLLDGLRAGGDRHLEHSLIYALIQINDRRATLPALSDPKPHVRRAGLVALDQMKDGGLTQGDLVPLLDSEDADLQAAAIEVLARRPKWVGAAGGTLRAWLAGDRLSPGQERALSNLVLGSSGDEVVQKLVADALGSTRTKPAVRAVLIDLLAKARAESFPPTWVEALGQSLKHEDVAVRRQALAAVKTRNASQLDKELDALARDPKQPADVRIAALECLARRRPGLDKDAFALLTAQLAETADPLQRLAAARTLAASTLSDAQLTELAGTMRPANTMVLRLLLPLFGKNRDAAVGKALADALSESAGAEALSVAELDQALAGSPPEAKARAARLRDTLVDRQKDQAAYLAKLAAELEALDGNADRGQEIFLSQKATCYGCHRAVGRGGTVGPDLSKIGALRSRAELLESLIYPSLTVAPEYRTFRALFKDGRAAQGLIVAETPDAVVLRTTELANVRLARGDIEELTPSGVSLMPDGLEKTMTRQELRDLLEFLMRQR